MDLETHGGAASALAHRKNLDFAAVNGFRQGENPARWNECLDQPLQWRSLAATGSLFLPAGQTSETSFDNPELSRVAGALRSGMSIRDAARHLGMPKSKIFRLKQRIVAAHVGERGEAASAVQVQDTAPTARAAGFAETVERDPFIDVLREPPTLFGEWRRIIVGDGAPEPPHGGSLRTRQDQPGKGIACWFAWHAQEKMTFKDAYFSRVRTRKFLSISYQRHKVLTSSRPHLAWYLIIDGGEPVGEIYLSRKGEIGVRIVQSHQRCGPGADAVSMLMAMHGPQRFVANIEAANKPARKLFRKLGFKPIGKDTFASGPAAKPKSIAKP